MLVLSRKRGQTIHIGNNIVIRICQVKGNTVRIGIEAPEDIGVLRGELAVWHVSPLTSPTEPDMPSSAPIAKTSQLN